MKTAALLVIGDEILSGTTQDTNSTFITGQLARIGIQTLRILSIPDTLEDIRDGLKLLHDIGADVVLSTGGLGPTRDDRTKKALSEYFNRPLSHDEATWRHLTAYLTKKGRPEILEYNRDQAQILEGARVFQNDHGTAPCQMIESDGQYFFCLPGVPHETKHLIKDKIIPFLTKELNTGQIVVRVATVSGIPESVLSKTLTDWENELPEFICLSYLPTQGRIKLKLTAKGADRQLLEQELEKVLAPLPGLLGAHLLATKEERIEVILADLLLKNGLSLSTVESCTLGQVALLAGSVPGASAYLSGAMVTYQTEQKVRLAGVPKDLIDQHTAVSEPVAKAMAEGGRQRMNTDYCIATTGVAGPAQGEDGKEIGTVWIAIAGPENTFAVRYYWPFLEREDFIVFVANKALEELVKLLK